MNRKNTDDDKNKKNSRRKDNVEYSVKKRGSYRNNTTGNTKTSVKNGQNSGKGKKKIYTEDGETEVNEHYWNIAQSLFYAKYVVMLCVFIVVVLGIMFNSNEFSVENISYLLRYIDIQTTKKIVKQEIIIEAGEDAQVDFYKNNIIVINKDKLEIYDLNGRKNFSYRYIYSRPSFDISSKYILTYDIGYTKMEVFNSFSSLYSYKGGTPVYIAKINDAGNIAYLSSQLGYRSVVNIKSKDFSDDDFFSWKSDKFVVDIDISQNADKLVVAAFDGTTDGNYETEIITFNTSEDTFKNRMSWVGILPYYVKCHTKGFYVIFEDSVKFFDADDRLVSEFSFQYKKLLNVDMGNDKLGIVLNETAIGNENHIYILDTNGKILYDNSLKDEVTDIKFDETSQNLFVLSLNGLHKINLGNEKKEIEIITEDVEKTANKILYADEEDILVSGINKVTVIEQK